MVAAQACVHCSLGQWLEDLDRQARDTAATAAGRPTPLFSARAVPLPLQWVARVAVTLGSLGVVVVVCPLPLLILFTKLVV